MSFLQPQGGFVDIRLLTLNLPHLAQTVTLHIIVRPPRPTLPSSEPPGTLGRSIPFQESYFLLRELDDTILRNITLNPHTNLSAKNEQAVRTIINTTCRDNHTWCTQPELRALRSLGALSSRTPRASLIDPSTTIKLLRHFQSDISSMCLASVIISMSFESRLLSEFFLNLKPAVLAANARFGHDNSMETSCKLVRNLIPSPPPSHLTYPIGGTMPSNHPIIDFRLSALLSEALHSPKIRSAITIVTNRKKCLIGYQPDFTPPIPQLVKYTPPESSLITANSSTNNCAHTCADSDSIIHFARHNDIQLQHFYEAVARQTPSIPRNKSYELFHTALSNGKTPQFLPRQSTFSSSQQTIPSNAFVSINDTALIESDYYQKQQRDQYCEVDNDNDANSPPPDPSLTDEIMAQIRDMAINTVISSKQGSTDILLSYTISHKTPHLSPSTDPLPDFIHDIPPHTTDPPPLCPLNASSSDDPHHHNKSSNTQPRPSRILYQLTIETDPALDTIFDIDQIVSSFHDHKSLPRRLALITRLMDEDEGRTIPSIDLYLATIHDARTNPNLTDDERIKKESSVKDEIFARMRKLYQYNIDGFSVLSSEQQDSSPQNIEPPPFYMKLKHKPSLTMLPILMTPYRVFRHRPHFLFMYPDLLMRPTPEELNNVVNRNSHNELEKLDTSSPKSTSIPRVRKSKNKTPHTKPQTHPAYEIATQMHQFVMNSKNLPVMNFNSIQQLPSIPVCMACMRYSAQLSRHTMKPELSQGSTKDRDIPHHPDCIAPHQQLAPTINTFFLSLPGIASFQCLLALALLNQRRIFPYSTFDHSKVSYEQYCCGLVNQSLSTLLTELKQPLVFTSTLVEFSKEELTTFFTDTDYPRQNPSCPIPDAAIIGDTPVVNEDYEDFFSLKNEMLDDETQSFVQSLLDGASSSSIDGFNDWISSVDCFPYEITEETLPLFRSFLHQIESLLPTHMMRLWRHMGCYFSYEYPAMETRNYDIESTKADFNDTTTTKSKSENATTTASGQLAIPPSTTPISQLDSDTPMVSRSNSSYNEDYDFPQSQQSKRNKLNIYSTYDEIIATNLSHNNDTDGYDQGEGDEQDEEDLKQQIRKLSSSTRRPGRRGRGRKTIEYHIKYTDPSEYPDWVIEKLRNRRVEPPSSIPPTLSSRPPYHYLTNAHNIDGFSTPNHDVTQDQNHVIPHHNDYILPSQSNVINVGTFIHEITTKTSSLPQSQPQSQPQPQQQQQQPQQQPQQQQQQRPQLIPQNSTHLDVSISPTNSHTAINSFFFSTSPPNVANRSSFVWGGGLQNEIYPYHSDLQSMSNTTISNNMLLHTPDHSRDRISTHMQSYTTFPLDVEPNPLPLHRNTMPARLTSMFTPDSPVNNPISELLGSQQYHGQQNVSPLFAPATSSFIMTPPMAYSSLGANIHGNILDHEKNP